jgi:hypothetical protein
LVCLVLNAIALVRCGKLENLDAMNGGCGWGIYSPNHQTSRLVKAVVAWRTGQSDAPSDTVRCACHITWPLDSDRWSFYLLGHRTVRWCTGQTLFSVRCAIWLCSDYGTHYSTFNAFCRRPLARSNHCSAGTSDSPVRHRTLSGATSDSPVNYSGAPSRIPEGEQFGVGVPGAPDTIRWHTGQSGAPNQGTLRLTLALYI